MSAENTTDAKSSRRRRRMAESEEKLKNEVAEDIGEDVDEGDEDDTGSDLAVSRGVTAKKGRPTPGRRNRPEEEEEGNVVVRGVGGLRGYIQDTLEELRKVTWPTREEVRRLTVIVLIVTIISSLVLGGISLLFAEIMRVGIANPIVLVVTFVVAVVLVLGFIYMTTRDNSKSY